MQIIDNINKTIKDDLRENISAFLDDVSENKRLNETTGFKKSKIKGECSVTFGGTLFWPSTANWKSATAAFGQIVSV